jgi:aminoglycoside 6'-N-acetyltransferase
MFKFRLLTSDDFPLMLEWLSKEHVKRWWDDGDDTVEKVARHYGESNDVERFILVENHDDQEKPIGYFQYYFVPDGSIGIDQFIGETDYINRGVGEKSIKMFVQMILRQHQVSKIILDPLPENKRAIRCYEKIGFTHYETRKSENGQSAYMMMFDCNKKTS